MKIGQAWRMTRSPVPCSLAGIHDGNAGPHGRHRPRPGGTHETHSRTEFAQRRSHLQDSYRHTS